MKIIEYKSFSLTFTLLRRNITTTAILSKQRSYYEILGLQSDCSSRDIKNAYINLSKKHHPDKNPGQFENDKVFKQIQEAYSVLSKAHSRENYDLTLRGIHTVSYVTKDTVHRPWESQENRYQDIKSDNYYGIKGKMFHLNNLKC
jgi:DnaJ-class molecular chaperone